MEAWNVGILEGWMKTECRTQKTGDRIKKREKRNQDKQIIV
jgi:hypothetical protein